MKHCSCKDDILASFSRSVFFFAGSKELLVSAAAVHASECYGTGHEISRFGSEIYILLDPPIYSLVTNVRGN